MTNSDNPQAALRLAQSLATGRRNKKLSADKQLAGEAAARAGQVIGTYFGGIGGFVGKRIGRVLGENWRVVLLLIFLQIVVPLLFLTIGFFIILTTLQSFFGSV
jgi:hypothetical protein